MILRPHNPLPSAKSLRAFTMIEIVLCIGIVAFALVAILGVLPTGMTVQRQNSEDTVMNQEGQYWIEVLRSGSRGLDELTNHLEEIIISNDVYTAKFTNFANTKAADYIAPELIVGLLMRPTQEDDVAGKRVTNRVTARIRAITGSASSKGTLASDNDFRYQLRVEQTYPSTVLLDAAPPTNSPAYPAWTTQSNFVTALNSNLLELRLTFRWPMYERGENWEPGLGRKTYRALMAAHTDRLSPPPTNFPSAFYPQPKALYFPDNNEFVNHLATEPDPGSEHPR